MGKSSNGKPASGKRKDKDAQGSAADGPWLAVKGTLGMAGLAVLVALLSMGSSHWKKRQVANQAQADVDAAQAEVLKAAEQLKLMGHKVELQDKIDKQFAEATSMEEKMQNALKEKAELEALVAEAKAKKSPERLGPSVMQAQGKLLSRLLELAKEVDQLRGDDKAAERRASAKRVEAELQELEAQASQEDVGPAVRKQQAGLIALVRSAMQSEQNGGTVEDGEWNEAALFEKHGLITYASPSYWEEAFSGGTYGDSFEWYGSWEEQDPSGHSLAGFVRPLLKSGSRSLVLGCGNSNLSAVLHQEGQKSVASVDISEAVIQQMQAKYADIPSMEWKTMDSTKMSFDDASFDFVIEKGMFDALYAGSGEKVQSALSEVVRVLRPGARFVSVSFQNSRLTKLFGQPAAAGLDCQLAGEVLYQKAPGGEDKAADTEAADEKATTAIYVYVCERRP